MQELWSQSCTRFVKTLCKSRVAHLIVGALLLLPVNRRHAMVGDASGAGEGGVTK